MTILKSVPNFKELTAQVSSIESDTILVVIDSHVASIYQKFLKDLEALLQQNGKKVFVWQAPAGEQAKSLQEVENSLEFFLEQGVHRQAHLVAIGGGALSDMAGLVAAMCLRGISWSVIPTTLLSMIDASIGGKVGVNSRWGKNLIGAFHLPSYIWTCHDFLDTLPPEQIASGKGEMLKYFFLDEELFQKTDQLGGQIQRCAEYKHKLTTQDLKESGQRKILNLGHTFGHAFEKMYELEHGIAVYWGMVYKFSLFKRDDLLNQLAAFAKKLSFSPPPAPWENRAINSREMFDWVLRDKKKQGREEIDLIVVEDIGEVKIERFKLETLKDWVRQYGGD